MRFTFAKTRKSALIIDIGYNTPFQSCMYFISITKEYYDINDKGYSINYAKWIKGYFKHLKYWKK